MTPGNTIVERRLTWHLSAMLPVMLLPPYAAGTSAVDDSVVVEVVIVVIVVFAIIAIIPLVIVLTMVTMVMAVVTGGFSNRTNTWIRRTIIGRFLGRWPDRSIPRMGRSIIGRIRSVGSAFISVDYRSILRMFATRNARNDPFLPKPASPIP